MKDSTLRFILLILFTSFFVSSCTKEPLFPDSSDKIVGKWKFEQVKFRSNGSISSKDLTNEYKSINYQFDKLGNVKQSDSSTGEEYLGFWKIDCEFVGGEDDEVMEVLEGAFVVAVTGQSVLFDWENLMVTNKKIRATECRNGGTYTYKLVKD